MVPSPVGRQGLSEPEKTVAVATIGEVAANFQLEPVSNLDRIRQLSEEGARLSYQIIAQYWRNSDHSRIVLSVGISNESGEFAVTVVNLDKSVETTFTRTLEGALVKALTDRFPTFQIKVVRERYGPNPFGP